MSKKNGALEKMAEKDLLKKCYSYLYENFHKFNRTNKIRIALELVKIEKRAAQPLVNNKIVNNNKVEHNANDLRESRERAAAKFREYFGDPINA